MKLMLLNILFIFVVLSSVVFVNAEENEKRYIFSFKNDLSLADVSLDDDINTDDIEEISKKSEIYTADSETIETLLEQGLITDVEEDITVELADDYSNSSQADLVSDDSSLKYNDPYFYYQWYYDVHKFDVAKNRLGSGKGVRVAVIDSGVTLQPDFNLDNIEKGYNYINPEKTGNDVSDNDTESNRSHGTGVAGIIAAQSNNEIGIVGIAEDVTIVPLIIYQDNKAPLSNVITAIEDAVTKYNCDVINMSLTFKTESPNIQKVIDYAVENNVIVVAAVGNGRKASDPDSGKNNLYPASCESVIGVASLDEDLSVSSFSQTNNSVNIAVAGRGLPVLKTNGGVTLNKSGTSFSAPMITAFAALMKEKYPEINAQTFLEILKAGSYDSEDSGYDIYSGFGIFNAEESINYYESNNSFFISPAYRNSSDNLIKVYGENISGVLVCAVYDENGNQKYFDIEDFATDENNIFCKKITINIDTTDTIKVFAFDNLQNMKPISKIRLI